MLLRRITEHVKAQNWTAVTLDFLIVVFGIWAALFLGQWAEGRQARADLTRAEYDINAEIQGSYAFAYERLTVAPCRKARYRDIGDLLLASGTDWPGVPDPYGDGTLTKHRVFPLVLRSPNRPWSSSVWDSEMSKGTIDVMSTEKRQVLSALFEDIKLMANLQEEIHRVEARLQPLVNPLEMTASDRLRYYDALMEADVISASLELNAEQIIDSIENNKLVTFSEDERAAFNENLARRDAGRIEIYGDCVDLVVPRLLTGNDIEKGEN